MINALIIDDEDSGVQLLTKLVQKRHPDIALLSPASSVEEAILNIDREKPELIFLDIRLGTKSGFEVLEKTIFKGYHVIFVTAYSEYALKAIKSSAVDYLLKPIDMDDLSIAIERFKMRQTHSGENQLSALKTLLEGAKTEEKLVVSTREGFEFIVTSNVLYVIADENYANIHLTGGRAKFASKTLAHFEEQLPSNLFFRIHKSHLVNLNEIMSYEHGNGGYVKMSDGRRLEVSRRKKKELLSRIKAPVLIRTNK